MKRAIGWGMVALASALGGCVVEETEESPEAVSEVAVCGDGVVNEGEACDGVMPPGENCEARGFDAGVLRCTRSCTVDTSRCFFLDEDQDGLLLADEELHGTDPLNPDSDGDGLLDGREVEYGSDPTSMASWPHAVGMWPDREAAAQNAGVHEHGSLAELGGLDWWEPYFVPPNVALWDQHANALRLHQLYGYVVVINICAMWCWACHDAAADAQELFLQEMEADEVGVVFVELVKDGWSPGTNAIPEDVANWTSEYGQTFPVVRDGPSATSLPHLGYYPTIVILDAKLQTRMTFGGYPGAAALQNAIEVVRDASIAED